MLRLFHKQYYFPRVVAVLLVACFCGASLCGCGDVSSFGISGARPTSGVLINEVVCSNSRSLVDETLGSPDWIELRNTADTSINLTGCFLSDNIRNPKKWEFPAITLRPDECLVLYATDFSGELPEGVYCTGFGLSKSGESLYFTDRYLGILDKIDIPALPQDISYARDENGRFGYCSAPTPGQANTTEIVYDPTEISYITAESGLKLSEVLPENAWGIMASDGRRYPWAELVNTTAEPIRLREYWLSDDETNFLKWQMPDTELRPHERLLVFFTGSGAHIDEIHASFRLGGEDGALYLSSGRGDVVDALNWALPMAADIAVLAADGAPAYTAFPTPGQENDARTFSSLAPQPMDSSDPVQLNEVLVKNRYSAMDADGDRCEWAELYNQSAMPVSLLGYALSDDPLTPSKWLFPDVTIDAGGFLLVFLSGKNRLEGELHASFRLSDSDEAVLLTNMDGMRQSIITLTPGMPENISIGRDEDGALRYFGTPTPAAPNDSAGFEQLGSVPSRNPDGVYISEVAAVSSPKSGKPDWIELYNPTGKEKKLNGWYLSNDAADLKKYEIQALSIPSKGRVTVTASTRTAKKATLPFAISASGATLFLTDPDGILRDYFTTGALHSGQSAGRNEADATGKRVFYTTPTPGAANAPSHYPGYVAAPVFSQIKLYHHEPFALALSCATEGARIFYTLDGSKPDSASALYTAPLQISASTPVRAIALREGLLASEIATHTYLFTQEHTLPVVCLNGPQTLLNEVYAATERAQRVEREMHMEYFDAGGSLGVSSPCGLRATGASTLLAAQKSFTMFFRGGYGRSEITYPFFPGYEQQTFSALTLRNSGQDRGKARLRDSFFSLAAEGLFVDNIATRPVIVYLNGKYWGIYDLNENQNEEYLAAHYGVDPDAVDIIRRNITPLAGNNRDFKRVRAYGVGQNFADPAVYAKYCEWVDMDYVIDYLITQTYFANGDIFNQKYWGSHDYTVKWRPVLYDMDLALSASSPTRNILGEYFKYEGVPSQDLSITYMDIYCGLRNNAEWRERFISRYVYVVTQFYTSERLCALLDETAAELRPEMERHIKRWGSPSSLSAWEGEVKALRKCLADRPPYALKYLQNYFNLTDAQMAAYKSAAELAGPDAKPA